MYHPNRGVFEQSSAKEGSGLALALKSPFPYIIIMSSHTSQFPNPIRLLHDKQCSGTTLAWFRDFSIQPISSTRKLSSKFGAIYLTSAQYVKVHKANRTSPSDASFSGTVKVAPRIP